MISKRAYAMFITLAGVIAVFLLLVRMPAPTQTVRELDYKSFIQYLESNRIQTFDAVGLNVHGTLTDGQNYATEIPNRDTVLAQEIVKHVRGTVRFENVHPNSLFNYLLVYAPFAFVIVALMFVLRAAQRRPPS